MKTHRARRSSTAVLALLLSACGGGDEQVSPAVLPPLPAGTSRIHAVELDTDLDGNADQVVLYSYDDSGRLVAEVTSSVAHGAPVGDPQETVTRTYDADGRVVGIDTRGGPVDSSLRATYGVDGHLASTTLRRNAFQTVSRFTWTADRMTGVAAEGEPWRSGVAKLGYDPGGRVNSIIWDAGPQYSRSETYDWRPDGQLRSMTYADFDYVTSTYFDYDSLGRLVQIRSFDDGYEIGPVRLRHDVHGRPVRIENYLEDQVLVVTRRIVWEEKPCQPVYEPEVVPTVDPTTGMASPVGATLVCWTVP